MVRSLVVLSALLTLSLPAFANSTPVAPQLSQGTQLLNNFASGGINIQQFTNALTQTGNISLPDATQLATSIVGNQGANLGALGNVVNSVMGGNLDPKAALDLVKMPDLGKIANIGDLAKIVANPSIQNAISTALQGGGMDAVTKQLGSIFGAAATTDLAKNILQQAGVAGQLAQQVAGALGPAVTAAMGGIPNIQLSITVGLDGNIKIEIGIGGEGGGGPKPQSNNNNVMCNRSCSSPSGEGCCNCHKPIVENHKNIRALMTNEFEAYRTWLVSRWWVDNMAPALMIMTSQMHAAAMQQIETFGMMLDAKHQLETQRVFQQMTARAHKDYQPSEGLCEFGTNTRSLAASERRADLSKVAFSERMLQRSLKSGDNLAVTGSESDKDSRLKLFLEEYCDKNDNGKGEGDKGGLALLCKKSIPPARKNKDIDYTRTIETPLSLDIDFTKPANTDDEKDVFALAANLYAHDIPEKTTRDLLANDKGEVRPDGYPLYMDLRAITAKRSVAQNSMAAIASMKSRGAKEVAPFLKAFIKNLGLEETEINKLIGDEPSYFAQMEVLTKKVYEDPVFYANLYDKPANVERKIAVMEALEVMQDRDIYDSLLRSEAVLAMYLETLLDVEQQRVSSEINRITNTATPVKEGAASPAENATPTPAQNNQNQNNQNQNNQNQNNQNQNNQNQNTQNQSATDQALANSAASGATMWNNLSNGSITAQQAADILAGNGHINPADASAVVQGLQSTSNIDRELKARILDSVLNGSIHPQVAVGLATTQNAGNINRISDVAGTLTNASTRAGLEAVYDRLGASGLAQHIGLVVDTTANYPLVGQIRSDDAALNSLLNSIESATPDLIADAGGRDALAREIRAVINSNGYLRPPPGGWNNSGGGNP